VSPVAKPGSQSFDQGALARARYTGHPHANRVTAAGENQPQQFLGLVLVAGGIAFH